MPLPAAALMPAAGVAAVVAGEEALAVVWVTAPPLSSPATNTIVIAATAAMTTANAERRIASELRVVSPSNRSSTRLSILASSVSRIATPFGDRPLLVRFVSGVLTVILVPFSLSKRRLEGGDRQHKAQGATSGCLSHPGVITGGYGCSAAATARPRLSSCFVESACSIAGNRTRSSWRT